MNRLWIVEVKYYGRWKPTLAVAFTRTEGRRLTRKWRAVNSQEQFRLVCYRAQGAEYDERV